MDGIQECLNNLQRHIDEALRKFHSLLGELNPGEVFFVSLGARRKYMDEAFRALFRNSENEMFARRLVTESSFAKYKQALLQYETEKGWYADAKEPGEVRRIPDSALAVYTMINPCNAKAAVAECAIKMTSLAFSGGEHASNHYTHAMDRLLSCFQSNRSRRNWIDIDIDIPDSGSGAEAVADLFREAALPRVTKHIIATRGGYHLLVKADEKLAGVNLSALTEKYNNKLLKLFPGEKVEIRRTDGLIPVPGTYQGGYPVHFVDPEML